MVVGIYLGTLASCGVGIIQVLWVGWFAGMVVGGSLPQV